MTPVDRGIKMIEHIIIITSLRLETVLVTYLHMTVIIMTMIRMRIRMRIPNLYSGFSSNL